MGHTDIPTTVTRHKTVLLVEICTMSQIRHSLIAVVSDSVYVTILCRTVFLNLCETAVR
jgi:hypothetical protein